MLLQDGFAGVEALLGGAASIDAAAVASGALRRRRGVRDGSELLRLALTYATAGGSLRTTAAWSRTALGTELSAVALFKRLREAGDFLEGLVRRLLDRSAQTTEAFSDWDGPPIRLVDGSVFAGPRGAAQMRLHATYDPVGGRFETLELTPMSQGEGFGRVRIDPGVIAVGDRVFARTVDLRRLAATGAYFLVRAGARSLGLIDASTKAPVTPADLVAAIGEGDGFDRDLLALEIKPKGDDAPLPIRLVALRASPDQLRRERARIRRTRTKQGVTPHPATHALAPFVLLATNLDRDRWPPARLGALFRLRWQIELAFKTLKSTFRMREPPAKDPRLLRTWLLANLAAALLAQILADDLEGAFPPSAPPFTSPA